MDIDKIKDLVHEMSIGNITPEAITPVDLLLLPESVHTVLKTFEGDKYQLIDLIASQIYQVFPYNSSVASAILYLFRSTTVRGYY